MKKILIILSLFLLFSCENPNGSNYSVINNKNDLPEYLKNIEFYTIQLTSGEYVTVGVLDNNIVSNSYMNGKTNENIILVNKRNNKIINIKSIISENDSIIVAYKFK